MDQENGNLTNKYTRLRQSAEDWLQHGDRKTKSVNKADFEALFHELNTYQIELEMQNEELRQAQEELELSRRRYVDLYDHAPVGYLTLSGKGLIIRTNLSASEMLGLEREYLLNKPFSDFILPDDQDTYYSNRKKLLDGPVRKQSYQVRLQNKDGQIFHTQIDAIIYYAAGSTKEQFRLILTDISPLKKLETTLRRVKDRYRAIVMDQNDLVCRFDAQGKITFVNDAYCKCFEVKHQEILGTNFSPNIYKDDLELVKNHFVKLTMLKPQQTIEHRVILPSGEVRWQQWFGKAFYDEQGELLECQGVGRDITDLKNIQEKLQEELQLRQLFMDALPGVALLIEHKTRKIIAANKAAFAMGVVSGSKCYETWGQRESPCPCCLAQNLNLSDGEPQNCQLWSHDRYWDVYWIPINDEQYINYGFDITESQKDKEALKKIHEELEKTVEQRTRELQETHAQLLHVEKLAAVGKLSASIAHEFNNPLQGVMTVLKEIERHAALDETEAELVGMAFNECERMRNLIASLRDFNRPSSGEIAPVNLHANIDSLLLLSKKEFDRHKITVEKDYGSNIPHIMAVHDQLKQVFLNLLGNAVHACIEKKGKSKIQIRTEVAGENIAIHIQDNGIGIQPDHIKHIFEPFFSTKPEQKGTGLGLSISYGIIKKHAGRIDVISKPGKGSTFSVYLPIKGSNQEEEAV